MSFPRTRPFHRALVGLCVLPWLQTAPAIERFHVHIEELASADWLAQGVSFTFAHQAPEGVGYGLEIAHLHLPALEHSVQGLRIDCAKGSLDGPQIGCEQGRLRLSHPWLEDSPVSLSFMLDRSTGRFTGELRELGFAGGRLRLQLDYTAEAWRLQFNGRGLQPAALVRLLPAEQRPFEHGSYSGGIELDGELAGDAHALVSARWSAVLVELGFSDASGLYAGDGLEGRFEGSLSRVTDHWEVESELEIGQGEILSPALYLNAGEHPLRLAGGFALSRSLRRLRVHDVRIEGGDLLALEMQAELDLRAAHPLTSLKLRARPFEAGRIYRDMLQPVLSGTPWGRFELAGEVALTLALGTSSSRLELSLEDFHLDDREIEDTPRRLGLYGVNGRLYWNRGAEPRPSWIEWQAGHLLEHVDIGPGRIDFQANDARFSLTRQLEVPLLDGRLLVDRLQLSSLGAPEQTLRFDGMLEPISMRALSEALGWLPLSGKLSGMLPDLSYRQGLFEVGGVLLVRMFDGDILIKHLRVQDLFGVYPQLRADIELDNLDLETLTETFSFGRITGRLDGYVRELRLEDWRPVAFDAMFYTPQDDDSRHRISQKAVDNISNLGGAGLSGSVARTFLGVFDEFRYDRLGIGCRLHQGICDMVGVAEAEQGYYLVQGSGIPRIDIIGYNRSADWSRLVEQLTQITQAGEPVIR